MFLYHCAFQLKQLKFLKKQHFHLILSIAIVVPVAITYGLMPEGILQEVLHFKVEATNLANIFRAIMGLYLGMATFWIIGILYPTYWKAATLVNILFMGGLAFGRIISMVVDGQPSIIFSAGVIGELVLAGWGVYNLKKYK